ncbi:response regulator [Erythrobacter mangrovi]|uniref:Response regulator n=1 Tax=Erythrobacter mangrovi TaxID=2739433 RepID=A0A7D4CEJ2_9SPHN|nr:response regulator [Erythrobacter mangrovi]QKG72549.1 response regulator [Erythrobacter mangrovi]
MNLDIGILWIEDSFSADEEASLRRRVEEAGFIARIDTMPNGEGIEERARKHQLYHVYDIILLDYRLQNENGDDLAPKVRQLFPATSILFYSGSEDESTLRQLIAANAVEGVFCSARQGGRFIERAGSLIDQTARSLDRLSGMRGLAMKVVAECDDHMKRAVLSMTARDEKCAAKMADLDNDVSKDLDGVKDAYQAASDLDERMKTRAVDSMKLFKHFRRLTQVVAGSPQSFGLDLEAVDELRELRTATKDYGTHVLGKRNVLGHVVEVEGDAGWELSGSDTIAIGDFPEIRQAFASHIKAVRRMTELVTLLDTQ